LPCAGRSRPQSASGGTPSITRLKPTRGRCEARCLFLNDRFRCYAACREFR
jgi:hypothetical protein